MECCFLDDKIKCKTLDLIFFLPQEQLGGSVRSQSPSKVSNLREKWEQQIRENSPDRQQLRSASPTKASSASSIREFPSQADQSSGCYRAMSPSKSSSALLAEHRSRSPVKSSATTNGVVQHRSRSPIKSSSALPCDSQRGRSPFKSASALTFRTQQSGSPVKSASALPHEAQRSRSPVKKLEDFGQQRNQVKSCEVVKGVCPMPPTEPVLQEGHQSSVAAKVAAFTAVMDVNSCSKEFPERDPAELSMMSRRQLFEKQGGEAILPKAPFAQSVPAKMLQQTENHSHQPQGSHLKAVRPPPATSSCGLVSGRKAALEAAAAQPAHDNAWQLQKEQEMAALQNRFPREPQQPSELHDVSTSDSDYPESEVSTNHGRSNYSPGPPKPPRTFASPERESSFAPRIKPGCLYPGLSDLESMSSEAESMMDESAMTFASVESLGTKIQQVAQSQRPSELNTLNEENEADIDFALNEALSDDTSSQVTPPKRCRDEEQAEDNEAAYKNPRVATTPLQHTISMYRKQKPAEINYTPVRKVVIRPEPPTTPSSVVHAVSSPSVALNATIARLVEEEARELRIISQASVAVSIAEQRPDQFGSTHHIEAEKLLLLACHRRQAIMNEIQRLKTEVAVGSNITDETSFGQLSITEVTLPLSQDFLNRGIQFGSHHVVLLTKYREQVIASSIQSTPGSISNASLTFPSSLKLEKLTPDFKISLEVFALKLSNPSSALKKDSSRMKLTPLKRLHNHKHNSSPVVSSPGGPNAIRTPSFTQIGSTQLSISTLNRSVWSLDKVPISSPLNGQVVMKVQCSMEKGVTEKSFLTVFQDVGGFGAWTRRWAVLSGDSLRFWTYPEQENQQDSSYSVSLKQVITRKVELVSRDVCARAHTFLLTTERPTVATDTNSLTTEITATCTVTKLLLSADSSEERQEWCRKLNVALANIRAWHPEASRPHDYNV